MLISTAILFLCLTLAQPTALFSSIQEGPRSGFHDRPYLEYGNICWEDERALLDTFAFVLSSDPDTYGFLNVYDGSPGCRDEAIARAIRARNYLVNNRGIEWDRVAWRYGGQLQELTISAHLYPRGMRPLEPRPTLAPSESKEDCKAKMYRRGKCLVR